MAKRISAVNFKPSAAEGEIHYVNELREAQLPASELDALHRIDEVLRRVPVSKATWYAGVKVGRFPQPVKIGRSSAWRLSEINLLVAGRWQARVSA